MDKFCSKCEREKSTDDFNKQSRTKDGLRVWCRLCDKTYNQNLDKKHRNSRKVVNNKKYRLERYKMIAEYLADKSCLRRGESDPVVLEFDHRDREAKSFSISEGVCKPWIVVLEELKKCDVLCANCHRRKTAADLGWHQ